MMRPRIPAVAFVVLILLAAATAGAHGGAEHVHAADGLSVTEHGPQNWHELLTDWAWEPGSCVALVFSGGLYAFGLARLWRDAGIGHGIHQWEAACFLGGWLTLVIALVSPLHPWGSVLFSAHMSQHELLMLVAAPLLVLGRPMLPFLHALPRQCAHDLGQVSNTPIWHGVWGLISNPFVAWVIHAVVLWGWHAPVLFQATQKSDWVHAAQHASFLGSALLFWWSLLHARRTVDAGGAAVLYLFTTALHSGFLGAMLTFAKRVWYPVYGQSAAAWGLTPLEDQQLGGLIMWIPACAVYIVAALFVAANWLRAGERAAKRREATHRAGITLSNAGSNAAVDS